MELLLRKSEQMRVNIANTFQLKELYFDFVHLVIRKAMVSRFL